MKTLKILCRKSITLFCLMLSLSFTLYSQNLAIWDFEASVNTPSFTEVNMTADPAAFGPTLGTIGFVSGNGSASAYTAANWSLGSLDPDKYIEFTVGPAAGYMMTLTNFDFQHRRSSTGVHNWELRSSLDGFASTIASNTIADVTNWFLVGLILPADFQDLAISVTFRIYGFNAEGTGGTWRFDNVFFTGTVAEYTPLPEAPIADWAVIIGLVLISTFIIIRFRKTA